MNKDLWTQRGEKKTENDQRILLNYSSLLQESHTLW
jgi:hypothetical protein